MVFWRLEITQIKTTWYSLYSITQFCAQGRKVVQAGAREFVGAEAAVVHLCVICFSYSYSDLLEAHLVF